MPNENTALIIDLTEIVKDDAPRMASVSEEGELHDQVSDLMGAGVADGDDLELDDLLAQLNTGGDDDVESGPVVNPNESLDMPGMDDMDALMGQVGVKPASKGGQAIDLDDLLSGLDDDEPVALQAKKAPAAAPMIDLDSPLNDADLDDLLAGDEPPMPKKPKGGVDDELDDLLADLDEPDRAPAKKSAKEPDLDDLLAGLDDEPAPAQAPAAVLAAAGKAGKAVSVSANPLEDDAISDLFNEFDASVVAAIEDDDLDALLAQAPKKAAAAPSGKVEPETPAAGGDTFALLREQVNGLAATVRKVAEQQQNLDAAGAGDDEFAERLDALEEQIASLSADVITLQAQLGASGGGAAAMTSEDTQALAKQLMQAMRPDIEKAAAAAAATIIREEVLAAFAGDD